MNLNRKKAPGRLTRAIVTLAVRTGNKLMRIGSNDAMAGVSSAKEFNPAAEECQGYVRLSERSTITVETERLLIVSRKRTGR
jgi:hypothetical protein